MNMCSNGQNNFFHRLEEETVSHAALERRHLLASKSKAEHVSYVTSYTRKVSSATCKQGRARELHPKGVNTPERGQVRKVHTVQHSTPERGEQMTKVCDQGGKKQRH